MTVLSPDRLHPRLAIPATSVGIALTAGIFFLANGGLYRFPGPNGALWLLATAMVGFWFLRSPLGMARMLLGFWPAMLFPLIALLSALWSSAPGATLGEAVQLLVTILICLRIGSVLTTKATMLALALAMTLGVVATVANIATGFLPPVYEVNGALLGIFPQKTVVARIVFLAAFAIVALGLLHRRPLPAIIIAAGMFPLVSMAKSVTGEIGYLFIGLLVGLFALRNLPIGARVLLPVLALLTLAALTLIYVATGGALLADLLALAGKNSTLTGRTLLWDIGLGIAGDSPLVGIGYEAFWTSPTYALAVSEIYATVDDGLHGFHNAYIEAYVATGLIGLAALVWMQVLAWTRLLRVWLVTRSVQAAIWLALLTAICLLAVIDDTLLKPRSGFMMLTIIAYVWSVRLTAATRSPSWSD